MPQEFKISICHHFCFSSYWKDTCFARMYSTRDDWDRFAVVKTERSFINNQEILNSFESIVPALSEIKATKDLRRKAYLTKNICDRYFKNDADFKKYFSA